jgi:geranylgeranyl diphosphate synthase type II
MTTFRPQATAQRLGEYLEHARRRVDEALDGYLPALTRNPKAACPSRLAEAMRYSVQGGGKRLRPILALMAGEACGADFDQALPAACALEMIHTYSLIHDDLPAMDDDELRRGRPTCHRAFDEATAILAGDALLTLAFEVTARDITPREVAAECVLVLAGASGMSGMVGGQMSDIEAESRLDPNLTDLEWIHVRKTGALLSASLTLGGIVGRASRSEVLALQTYGHAVGLAFQIVDDVLDVEGDESKLGKRVRKDEGHGKWTYPGLLGVEESRTRAQILAQDAVTALEPFGTRGERLCALAWTLVERDR